MKLAVFNGQIFTGEEVLINHAVLVDNGMVLGIVPETEIPESFCNRWDLNHNILAPGFIDLQVNGGGGIMFNSAPTVETISKMSKAHRKFGTTGFMPTLITDDYSVMKSAVNAVECAINENIPGVLGIHLEGPFLSEIKKGAHDANKFCKIDKEGFEIMTSLSKGKTIVTIAPELADPSIIGKLSQAGVVICAGHSNADYEQTTEALRHGLNGFTHLYNAMTPLQSRLPGMVGAAISDDSSWFGIIADGFHMHPAAFKIAVKAKKQGGAILVTDAMATVGSISNSFELNGETIRAINGKCENAAGSLAGSDLNMNDAVLNTIKFANLSWQEAIRMASLYPAKALNLDHQLGKISAGYHANFVSINKDLVVEKTWINGV